MNKDELKESQERYRSRRRGRAGPDENTHFDPEAYESIAAHLVSEFLEEQGELVLPPELLRRFVGLDRLADQFLDMRAGEIYERIEQFMDGSPDAAGLWAADRVEVMLRVLEREEKRLLEITSADEAADVDG